MIKCLFAQDSSLLCHNVLGLCQYWPPLNSDSISGASSKLDPICRAGHQNEANMLNSAPNHTVNTRETRETGGKAAMGMATAKITKNGNAKGKQRWSRQNRNKNDGDGKIGRYYSKPWTIDYYKYNK